MKMNAQTVGWLVFLAITKNISSGKSNPFILDDKSLTATKGSCIEIQCRVTTWAHASANWFWLKDGRWNGADWKGTVIYSTDTAQLPVSADFADRVKYIGSPSASWNSYPKTQKKCSILICDLKETDNGNYSLRFNGTEKWITKPAVWLNVKENLCPITFEKPPVVNESGTVTLTCSTLTSCTFKPQIGDLTQLSPTQPSATQSNGKTQSTSVSFMVSWQDHGMEFTCQTNVTDKYLIRKISLTVEYAPKDILVQINPANVLEGTSVTLTCSAKGRPDPNFTWFNNTNEVIGKGAVWTITSIKESENRNYYCEANNIQGTRKSNQVIIDVKYVPEVEMTSLASIVIHGSEMTLTCNVKRSNPNPYIYTWYKDEKEVQRKESKQYVKRVEPEDGGVYKCSATNIVGTGSSTLTIEVRYGPRKTNISISENDKRVKVGKSLRLFCNTEANPAPNRFSWYRYNSKKQADSSQWKSKITNEKELRLDTVQRADEACYRCNATNHINTGEDSKPVCIEVLYAPTKLTLSMDTEVREGRLITIRCTVESFPPSTLTLKQTSNPQPPKLLYTQPSDARVPNTLQLSFNVTSTHTGSYTCVATNSEGSETSERRELVVTYSPKDVTVKARTDFVVDENKSLTLDCSARSYPPVTSFTWMKMTDGKNKILQKTQTFTLKSVSPSDSGLYSCEASNDIGTGNSEQTEVIVKYPPKHTNITTVAEHQQPDGTDSVTLRCSSQSYPPVTQYSWYKMKADKGEEKVSDHNVHTVYSDQPGVYYCIAQNEMYKRKSDPIHLFDRRVMKTLLIVLFLIILISIFLIVVIYRHKRKKSGQQRTANTLPCFGFLGWWNGAWRKRGRRMNDPGTAGPFRSRDDLLPDQPHRPSNAQRCQPRADSTPASNIHSVYSTVNLPFGQQGPPAHKIIRQQGGHKQDDSLTYASLDFGNKQKRKEAKAEDVYAKVSKKKPPNKNDERLEDYENAGAPMNYDTDTSEDEVQLNYSQVTFKAKPGHQPVGRDSSSFDEDETQYSEVKI